MKLSVATIKADLFTDEELCAELGLPIELADKAREFAELVKQSLDLPDIRRIQLGFEVDRYRLPAVEFRNNPGGCQLDTSHVILHELCGQRYLTLAAFVDPYYPHPAGPLLQAAGLKQISQWHTIYTREWWLSEGVIQKLCRCKQLNTDEASSE